MTFFTFVTPTNYPKHVALTIVIMSEILSDFSERSTWKTRLSICNLNSTGEKTALIPLWTGAGFPSCRAKVAELIAAATAA